MSRSRETVSGEGGWRFFWWTPRRRRARGFGRLTRGCRRRLEVSRRPPVNTFNAVQNTYLDTFQLLGGWAWCSGAPPRCGGPELLERRGNSVDDRVGSLHECWCGWWWGSTRAARVGLLGGGRPAWQCFPPAAPGSHGPGSSPGCWRCGARERARLRLAGGPLRVAGRLAALRGE